MPLRLRYGGTHRVRRACLRRLDEMPVLREGDFAALSRFSADLSGTISTLRNSGKTGVLHNEELLHKVVSKLYKTDWAHIVVAHRDEELNLTDFRKWIGEIFEADTVVNNFEDHYHRFNHLRRPISPKAGPGAIRNEQ